MKKFVKFHLGLDKGVKLTKAVFHIYTINTDFGLDIDLCRNNSKSDNENVSQKIVINENAVKMYNRLILIFCELRTNYIFISNPRVCKLNPITQMTQDIRGKYEVFIEQYSKENKKLLSFKKNLDSIGLGEYFFIAFSNQHTAEEIIFIDNLLKAYSFKSNDKERTLLFSDLQKKFDKILGKITKKYDVKVFDSDRKKIGEKNKEKRICRFCNNGINTTKKVTFRNKAHIIPEALGNKGLITYEECDECNNRFGKTIEKDLIAYFDIFRVFYGVKGKNGIPTLKFDNYTQIKHYTKYDHNKLLENASPEVAKLINNNLIVIVSKNINFSETTKNLSVPLESRNNITLGNIYKAFCKMIINLVERDELKYLQNTISWINSEKEEIYAIPKIASAVIHSMYVDNPQIAFYIRKDNDSKLPHIVGEFSFKCFKYVFIVPFSDKDKLTFVKDEEYEYFRKNFYHYDYIKNWSYHKMNSTIPQKFTTNMQMQRNK